MSSTSSEPARADLENDVYLTSARLSMTKEKVQPSTSHDAQYWTSAAAVCEALAKHLHAKTKLAIWDSVHTKDEVVVSCTWSKFKARRRIERIQAATLEKELYTRQAERIGHGGHITRAVEAMFKASQLGICAAELDIKNHQNWTERTRFKDNLIEFYDAATSFRPGEPKVLVIDTVTGLPFSHQSLIITPTRLFPYSLGPDVLVALFGEKVQEDLMAAQNGLLLLLPMDVALDDGVIAIIPDIPDDPTTAQVAAWEQEEPKNYKWRIIDEDAECLDYHLLGSNSPHGLTEALTIRDLDNKRLFFNNDNRPHPRYLFFLSAVAQLKMVWRHRYQYRNDPAKRLKLQLGKGLWVTAGKYLNRAFLRALAKQIGHDDSTDEECNGVTEKGIWATTGKYLNRALLAVAGQIGYDLSFSDNIEEGDGETGLVVIAKIIAAQQCRGEDEYSDDETGCQNPDCRWCPYLE
ncbi:hypothetical protein V8F06_004210 [Rhypophila decipiens]